VTGRSTGLYRCEQLIPRGPLPNQLKEKTNQKLANQPRLTWKTAVKMQVDVVVAAIILPHQITLSK